jgi:hypothetical protein
MLTTSRQGADISAPEERSMGEAVSDAFLMWDTTGIVGYHQQRRRLAGWPVAPWLLSFS